MAFYTPPPPPPPPKKKSCKTMNKCLLKYVHCIMIYDILGGGGGIDIFLSITSMMLCCLTFNTETSGIKYTTKSENYPSILGAHIADSLAVVPQRVGFCCLIRRDNIVYISSYNRYYMYILNCKLLCT